MLLLDNNRIGTITADFHALAMLKKVHLGYNNIAALDDGMVANNAKLTYLNLNSNLLEALPLIAVCDYGGGDGACQCAHLARVRVRV